MNVKYGIQNEFRIFYIIHCRMRKMGMTKKNQVMPDKVLSKEFEEDRIGIFQGLSFNVFNLTEAAD